MKKPTKLKNLKHQSYKFLTTLFITILATGTIFYHFIEGWNWIDSLYFSLITLTTIGYGDLTPTLTISKLFTMLYVVVGIGIIFGFIGTISRRNLEE